MITLWLALSRSVASMSISADLQYDIIHVHVIVSLRKYLLRILHTWLNQCHLVCSSIQTAHSVLILGLKRQNQIIPHNNSTVKHWNNEHQCTSYWRQSYCCELPQLMQPTWLKNCSSGLCLFHFPPVFLNLCLQLSITNRLHVSNPITLIYICTFPLHCTCPLIWIQSHQLWTKSKDIQQTTKSNTSAYSSPLNHWWFQLSDLCLEFSYGSLYYQEKLLKHSWENISCSPWFLTWANSLLYSSNVSLSLLFSTLRSLMDTSLCWCNNACSNNDTGSMDIRQVHQ